MFYSESEFEPYRTKHHQRTYPIIESDLELDSLAVNTAEKLRRRIIKNFMDILILTELKKEPMSGYDVMGLIHRKFDVLISSGTVYSLLYSLERHGLIKGVMNQRTRIYELTEKGERDMKLVTKAHKEIQSFLKNISLLNAS